MAVSSTTVKTIVKTVGKTAGYAALESVVHNVLIYTGSKIDNKINSRGSKGSKKKRK